MQPDEILKLKSLVNSSSILSLSEKMEWLGLLDVMDEGQRGELERILLGNTTPPPFAEASGGTPPKQGGEASNFAKASSDKPQLSSVGSQMPKLSHIMNLPNLNQAIENRQEGIGSRQEAAKKPSAFASKLRDIFKEKELPAGHPELELPEGERNRNKEIENRNREINEIRSQKTQAAEVKPFFPVKEKPLADYRPVKSIPSAPKIPQPSVPKPKAVPPVAMPVKPAPIATLPVTKAPTRNAQSVNTPADLALLGNQALRDMTLDTLVKTIKALIAKYGYFEVIFNLEKSPLFKNYIDSGLKLLAGQSGLGGDNLTKEEFEEFADLLAKIQSS